MLGFGKKKKEDEEKKGTKTAPTPPSPGKKAGKQGKTPAEEGDTAKNDPTPKKKKTITKKKVIILLLVLGVIGACLLVYTTYFTKKGSETTIYKKIDLTHVKLPEEIMKFTFKHFPDLYFSLVNFNAQITLFDTEITRIKTIAQKYPEQKKITDTEKKVLEKGKNTLVKQFSKLEKPIKETYVLFQVNETRGLARIKEQQKELTGMAQTALKTAQEQTKKIKSHTPQVPKGIIQGTLYKLKKKFL
ncbi:MAG: hypothetical protein GY710_08400 [Desulfobacteraceae bacterium]|nr:hypothetical protein [Desulfobacteraceae bacterium]